MKPEPKPRWSDSNRRWFIGALILVLVYGFWSIRLMLLDDFPRMSPWRRYCFWLGDFGALFYAACWMVSGSELAGLGSLQRRKIILAIIASLALDIGFTLSGEISSYQSMNRLVKAKAQLVSASVSSLAGRADHFRWTVRFDDDQGGNHQGLIRFSNIKGKPKQWVFDAIVVFDARSEDKPIEVMYDPELPARVFLPGQTWGSLAGIGPIFVIIHVAQCLVLYFALSTTYHDTETERSHLIFLPLVPIVAEAVLLVLAGLLLHQA